VTLSWQASVPDSYFLATETVQGSLHSFNINPEQNQGASDGSHPLIVMLEP
jgi:hypothetical protein